jgi:MFS transporter, DHA1 family, tetracycline resistance protein
LRGVLARQVGKLRQGELQSTLTSLIGMGGRLVVTAAFAAKQFTWPGSFWTSPAVFYLLALPMLFSRRARVV